MSPDLALDWQEELPPIDVCVIGDVQAVIESRAGRLGAIPLAVTHGLGALSAGGPAGAGEGAVLRGWTAATPPVARAGLEFSYHPTTERVGTPFFMGWAGAPAAVGRVAGEALVSVRQVYEAVFARLAERSGLAAPAVFLELTGLFPAAEIHDRALKAPVHAAHVPITDAAHAPDYFVFKIIQRDLQQRGAALDQLLPLAVVGAGFQPGAAAPDLQRFERAAFYEPPAAAGAARQSEGARLKTHSHALGWRTAAVLRDGLGRAARQDDWRAALREVDTLVLPDLLRSAPDYVVHLDEWSRMAGGVVRVFVPAAPDRIRFVAV